MAAPSPMPAGILAPLFQPRMTFAIALKRAINEEIQVNGAMFRSVALESLTKSTDTTGKIDYPKLTSSPITTIR
jgi:hypothetical protein